jgi:hypothetical protein
MMIVDPYRFAVAGGGGFGSHRYWRVFVDTNSGDATFIAAAEIEFRATAGGADQCSGGTPIKSGEAIGNEATRAFDDDGNTAWGVSGTTNQWIGYDFGSAVTVAEAAWTSNTFDGATFARMPNLGSLDWSDDGTNWTEATTFGLGGWLNNTTRVIPEEEPAAGEHRLWRIFVSTINGGTRTSIPEIQFRATSGGADQATGGRAYTSSENVGAAASAFDDTTATEWSTTNTTNQHIGYAFTGPVAVQEVVISGPVNTSRAPNTFKIQSSDDGVTWTDEKSLSGVTWTASEVKTYSVP